MQKTLLACALALSLAGAATPVLAQSKGDWTLGVGVHVWNLSPLTDRHTPHEVPAKESSIARTFWAGPNLTATSKAKAAAKRSSAPTTGAGGKTASMASTRNSTASSRL